MLLKGHSFLLPIVSSQCIAFSYHKESDESTSEEFIFEHEPRSTSAHLSSTLISILNKAIL